PARSVPVKNQVLMAMIYYRSNSKAKRKTMAPGEAVPQMPVLITTIENIEAARALPKGSVVGDLYGGLTFSDDVAAVLEARSPGGWQEVEIDGESWTVISLDR